MAKKIISTLVTELTADGKKMRRALEQNVADTKKWSSSVNGMVRTVQVGIAAIGLNAFKNSVVAATVEQERAVKQLEQGLKTTGGAVGLTLQQLTAHAAHLQSVTAFGDEQFISAQSKLATFTKITGDEFLRTNELAADLATRMEVDLTSATVQLAKALNDPVANLGALSRAGVQFSDDQKEVIRALFESGRVAEAQRVILQELEVQFGGSARAARDSFGGALTAVGNAAGDLLEADSLGGAKDDLEEFAKLLQDPQTVAAASALANAVITAFTTATKAIAGTVNVVRFLAEELAATVNGPAADDLPRLYEEMAEQQERLMQVDKRLAAAREFGSKRREQNALDEKKILDDKIASLKEIIDLSEKAVQRDAVKKYKPETVGLVSPSAAVVSAPASVLPEQKKTDDAAFKSALQDEMDGLLSAEKMLGDIASLEAALQTEDERIQSVYDNRKLMLETALEDKLITETRYAELTNKVQADYDKERRKTIAKGFESMLDIAGAYYDGVQTKEAARARFALQIGKTLLDEEKRNSLKKIAIVTYETAIKAYKAMAAIPVVGPALGAAAAGVVLGAGAAYGAKVAGIAHGGLTNVPDESTYLLQKNERVLSPKQNQDFTNYINNQRKNGAGVVVEFHAAPGIENAREEFERNGQRVIKITQMVRGIVHEELALQQEAGGMLNAGYRV